MNIICLLCLLLIYVNNIESSTILRNQLVKQKPISYPNHPFNSNEYQHRKLLQSTNDISIDSTQIQDAIDDIWSNIRITPYFDYLDNNTNYDTAFILKHHISAVIRYYEQFVKVVHTDKPLRLSKTCKYNNDRSKNCTTTCGDTNFIIPSEHLDTGWFMNEECEVMDIDAPGLGIADTDLIVYVSNEDYRCEGRSWQTVCEQDQFGRPIAILLNFCNISLEEKQDELSDNIIDLTIHELTHGLIFNRDYFSEFRNPINGNRINERDIISYINGSWWIISSNVRMIAQEHFNCNILPGVMLDSSEYHWNARMLNTELMNNDGYYMYLSKFTLALMKDSGWYRINDYRYAEPFWFGFNEGCQFIFGNCINKRYRISNYPLFWCEHFEDIGCFYDYLQTSTKCLYSENINEFTEYIPYKYQYFGYSSIGGPKETNYCPFLSPHHGNKCLNIQNNIDTSNIDHTFIQTFGHSNSRCIQTNSGGYKLTAACFDVYCMDYTYQYGYDHIIININDGFKINTNVTCYRNDEGATLNVICPPGLECLSITCPYIDIMCGFTQKPFECYYGHYDDKTKKCICNIGYKGDKCLNYDLGFEILQLYSSDDPIVITYYNTFCIYGLQWGQTEIIQNINGIWKIQNISNNKQYNPIYINENNKNFIIYYSACDEIWYIKHIINNKIIAKCYHNKFDWTDYGALISCNTYWYIDHELNNNFLRDINVLMSDGDETKECNELISSIKPFANYEYICIEEYNNINDLSGTYGIIDTIYNGYHQWNKTDNYLSFDGLSWYLKKINDNNYFYICYTFNNDPILCNNHWYKYNNYINTYSIIIKQNQCIGDIFPTTPTISTFSPSKSPTKSPIISADIIHKIICLSNAGGSFDGTYISNGTLNGRQIFIKSYLPQLQRPFIYLFYYNTSWLVYRDYNDNKNLWFLKCSINTFDVIDCNKNFTTSWSGNEPIITLNTGECQQQQQQPQNHSPTNKPTNHPITLNEVNNNYICVRGTSFNTLDGTYSYNGTFNNHPKYKKEYEPHENKPWVYIKFENLDLYQHWDINSAYGWIIYRKFHTQNYYFYCDTIWASQYYDTHNENDPNLIDCNGHWITNWFNDYNTNITLNYGMCSEDIIIPETNSPTPTPVEEKPITTKYCGSTNISNNGYSEICLNGIGDSSLSGIYKLNGTYNGYPAYVKEYLPLQNKPYVYIKYENVIMGDNDSRKQWILYRSYCAQTYYLYCQHSINSSDIKKCNSYWHTSWSGREINITSTTDINNCNNNNYNNNKGILPTASNAICMNNTGTHLLNGRYIKMNNMYNGYNYYRKSYDNNSSYVYIKYEKKWVIYNDLNDKLKYFLECDSSINSIDVTKCNGQWKGDPNNKLSISIKTIDCSYMENILDEINNDNNNNNNNNNNKGITKKQQRQVIIASIIIGFLFLICIIGWLCSKNKNKKVRFNRLEEDDDDDDNDSEIGGDGLDIDVINIESNITIDNNDNDNDNGIGGGTKQIVKQQINVIENNNAKTNKFEKIINKNITKFTNVFKKNKNKNKNKKITSEENVELVSSSNSNNSSSSRILNNIIKNKHIEDEVDDEFTSELDHDDKFEDNIYNVYDNDNNKPNNIEIEENNSISYVSPHNRLEID